MSIFVTRTFSISAQQFYYKRFYIISWSIDDLH